MFNAFKYTKKLEEVGFSREQAEIQLQVITEIVEGELATKQDLQILETNLLTKADIKHSDLDTKLQKQISDLDTKLQKQIGDLDTKLQKQIGDLDTKLQKQINDLENRMGLRFNDLENRIQQIEYRLTIKLGTLFVIGFTTMATLLKFWLVP